ncbi:MAG: prolipoprotein diacylglyceryl transferase family protein [Spirochaetota bacterium]
MKPILLTIVGVDVRSYTAFAIAGFGAGLLVFLAECRRLEMLNSRFLVVVSAGLFGSLLGMMLPLWAWHLWLSRTLALSLPQIFSGRTVVGGLIGGWIAVEIAKRNMGIRYRTGDPFAPALALGLAIGRVGCFLNGCCYGIPSDLPWACDFGDGIQRHPTQIYSAVFDLGLFAYLWLVRASVVTRGELFRRFLYLFGIFRFLIEFLRDTPKVLLGLSGFQWAMLGMLAWLILRDRRAAR